jgi:hypothetical protein
MANMLKVRFCKMLFSIEMIHISSLGHGDWVSRICNLIGAARLTAGRSGLGDLD